MNSSFLDTWPFECSIMGGVSTVWRGNAFECPSSNNEITLSHSQYKNSSNETYSSKSCNNGGVTIIAQIVGLSENTYTSQVTISDRASKSSLIGKSVNCIRDNGITTEVIRRYNITKLSLNDTSKNKLLLIV